MWNLCKSQLFVFYQNIALSKSSSIGTGIYPLKYDDFFSYNNYTGLYVHTHVEKIKLYISMQIYKKAHQICTFIKFNKRERNIFFS